MALMYPWATKEYLLWQMTIGQLIMYHNAGMQIRYPKPEDNKPSIRNMSEEDRKEAIRVAREAMQKQEYREKYGDV